MGLGYSYLEQILNKSGVNLNELPKLLNITPQAIQEWKKKQAIPAKRVSQISEFIKLSPQDIDRLLGNEPLNFEFRSRRGEHLTVVDVSEKVKVRTLAIYERFFASTDLKLKYDLSKLRSKIKASNENFQKIASYIREEFTIPNYRPLGADDLFALQDRIGVRAFYMPFKQLNLTPDSSTSQTAVLYSKDNTYTILVDSDRTVDEAHFDRMHEIVHVIFDGLFSQSSKLEKLIDQVCGDLIYPKAFIVEKFFNNDSNSKPIKNKEHLVNTFIECSRGIRHVLSPRGLARAMIDLELTTRNSELYNFLYSEFHSAYRKSSVTYSSYGAMNFNFSDREALLKFYKTIVETIEFQAFYPLFNKIKKDLVDDILSPVDFADTFNMKLSDALLIKAIWAESKG